MQTALAGGMWYLHEGPVVSGETVDPVSLLTGSLFLLASFNLANTACTLLGDASEWMAIRTPRGDKGQARLARNGRELGNDLIRTGYGPYWGAIKGKPVFSDFESSAFVLGPSGSGKTTRCVIPTIISIAHAGHSMTIPDFKSELAPMLRPLLERLGYRVVILNLGGLYPDRVGASETYNLLGRIAELYEQPGGLRHISDTVQELCLQLYREPANSSGSDDNSYFRSGSRKLLAFAIQTCILTDGDKATLGDVLQMLNERASLHRHAQWAAGRLEITNQDGSSRTEAMPIEHSHWCANHKPEDVERYIRYYRGIAAGIADLMDMPDSRTFESFVNGAQDALRAFDITSTCADVTSGSSFRFAEQKDGQMPVACFVMLDAGKVSAQADVLGAIMWGMFHEMKQHPDKSRPVYLIADEAGNLPLSDIGPLMTWSRGYGLRLLFILQNFDAFEHKHGKAALECLLSESEIALFLPGIRHEETLRKLEQRMGQQSYIATSAGASSTGASKRLRPDSRNFSEEGKAVMTADDIRHCKKAILMIRQQRPLLVDTPSIAEIAPWRKQVGLNPFHNNKAFLKPVRLRIRRRRQ